MHKLGRAQFRMRDLLLLTGMVAAALALARYLPLVAAELGFFCVWSAISLLSIALLHAACFRPASDVRGPAPQRPAVFSGPMEFLRRPLDYCRSPQAGWRESCAVLLLSWLVCLAWWPLIRLTGSWLSIGIDQPDILLLIVERDVVRDGLPFRPSSLKQLILWELGAFGRWLVLFCSIAGVSFLAAKAVQPARAPSFPRLICRVLLFSPVFVLLEIGFLATFWMFHNNTSPEPSTRWTAGVYSWDLWQWDCWLDADWLWRASLPTALASYWFFRHVLEVRWWLSIALSPLTIPFAILLSIAWSVLYGDLVAWLSL